ncbi:MAG: NAD(+) synthase [Alistipes sp.]|nr:NAD(+) synthase [Alistipes sp.]
MGRVRGGFIKVAAATPRVAVADCVTNAKRIGTLICQAAEEGVSIISFPELSITGSSCGVLFTQSSLLKSAEMALSRLLMIPEPIVSVVGMPVLYNSHIYDCAVVFAEGVIYGVVPKSYSNDPIFTAGRGTENRYITLCEQMVPFGSDLIFSIDGVKFGIEIGDDCRQIIIPSAEIASAGAQIAICMDAKEEYSQSYNALTKGVAHHSAAICGGYIYCSAAVGESSTDFVYAGAAVVAERGEILAERERFIRTDALTITDIDVEVIEHARLSDHKTTLCDCYRVLELMQTIAPSPIVRKVNPAPFIPKDSDGGCREVIELQAMGLAQRLEHTHCNKVVIGVSGGLDSTLALIVLVRTFDMLGLDRKGIVGVTMPGFGTTGRTYNNAITLMQELGITLREVSIRAACEQHFKDIDLDPNDRSAAYENSQARERTQILMDIANAVGGMVIGTGDLSESALGWATYNGDHMSMYNVNCSVPKTLVRALTSWAADNEQNEKVKAALKDIVCTPVSPELLPADDKGEIAQKTEDLVGPYELHDFFIYHFVVNGFAPSKILLLANIAFEGSYNEDVIKHWLKVFIRRFFAQQYKRSAVPDGPKVTAVSLSPRGSWMMPSDAYNTEWLSDIE